jgi:hypothetical protein
MKKGAKIWEKGRDRRTYQNLPSDFSYGGVACVLRVDNNKFSRQFLQVTFEMLQMSQVRLSLLFSWEGLEPSPTQHMSNMVEGITGLCAKLLGAEELTVERKVRMWLTFTLWLLSLLTSTATIPCLCVLALANDVTTHNFYFRHFE